MAPTWQNPNYERDWRRRRSLIAFAALLLIGAGALLFLALRKKEPAFAAPAAAHGPVARLDGAAGPRADASREDSAGDPLPAAASEEDRPGAAEAAETDGAGGQPDSFAARKALALALYRRNDLEGAREQAQAALALQRDEELIELLLKLRREIVVQRDYDDARAANFTVLYDGYEHEEMKVLVLDILKAAYADVGKELDHFPEEPITVILYTGKNFSDVTRAPGWAGGMFGKADGKIRLPVHGAEGQERALRRVLCHEYVHAVVHSMAPGAPMWLHEGLAQFLSGEEAVSVSQLIPLPILTNGFPGDARAAYAAYMVSLQAVTDLVDERGMPPLRRLLGELGAGKGIEQAFAVAYGEPFSRWARQWRPVERGESGEEDAQEGGAEEKGAEEDEDGQEGDQEGV